MRVRLVGESSFGWREFVWLARVRCLIDESSFGWREFVWLTRVRLVGESLCD